MIKVLFVCLGNICRSPTADGVFRKMVADAGLAKDIAVDSAGTSAGHVNSPPDKRAMAVAKSNGYNLKSLRARRLEDRDFSEFDYILGMDEDNLRDIREKQPGDYPGTSALLLDYANDDRYSEVPDPYYGGTKGFELVFELVEAAAAGLLEHIRNHDLHSR